MTLTLRCYQRGCLLADNKDSLTGKVRFMFQPGEEGFHGARYMIEEGVLDGVDRAFAIHVFTNFPAGQFAIRDGAILASADKFDITIHGAGVTRQPSPVQSTRSRRWAQRSRACTRWSGGRLRRPSQGW